MNEILGGSSPWRANNQGAGENFGSRGILRAHDWRGNCSAAAYERAFPSVRRARSAGGIGDGHTVRSAPQMDLDERIAMGGR